MEAPRRAYDPPKTTDAQEGAVRRVRSLPRVPDLKPALVVLRAVAQTASAPPETAGAWGRMGDELWPAWRGLDRWELCAEVELGSDVGQAVLVLWALSRFAAMDESTNILNELIDDDLRPRFGDPLVTDIAHAAFALGAAWNDARAYAPPEDAGAGDEERKACRRPRLDLLSARTVEIPTHTADPSANGAAVHSAVRRSSRTNRNREGGEIT